MYVFVDASGDPGLKILSGSSRYFTIALVAIQDEDVADCNSRIDQLRNTLMFPPSYEFHFSANSRKVRQAFLAAVASSKFFYHIYALDKSDLSTLKRLEITNSESLFRYVIMQACDNAKTYLNNAKVVIDGRRGDRKFRNELRSYLSREVRDDKGRRLIGLVRLRDSRKDNLLQLADYVAGVSNRVLNHAPDGENLHKYLAGHEVTFQIWPQK